MFRPASTEPIFFDVRLATTHKNTLMITTDVVVLEGEVVLSLKQKLKIKKLSLSLICNFKLEFFEMVEGEYSVPVREDSKVFECKWDNLLASKAGVVVTTGLNETQVHKFEDLDDSMSFEKGNYEFPFRVEVPAKCMTTTVEGLPVGSLLYQFQATVATKPVSNSKKLFSTQTYQKNRYLRVFKDLPPEALLVPSEQVSGTLKDVMQYIVEVPTKYVPIGSKFEVVVRLSPLAKHVSLSNITATLVEEYRFQLSDGRVLTDKKKISSTKVDFHTELSLDITQDNTQSNDSTVLQYINDAWQLSTFIELPNCLKEISVDCNNTYLSVSHKIKIKTGIADKNGRSLQLRASIPIIVYASARFKVYGRSVAIDAKGRTHFRSSSELAFCSETVAESLDGPPLATDTPPHYETHVYDRLYHPGKTSKTAQRPPMLKNQSENSVLLVSSNANLGMLSLEELNKVPSYSEAVEGPNTKDLAPMYNKRT